MSGAVAEGGGEEIPQKIEKKKEKKKKPLPTPVLHHHDEPGPVDLPLGKIVARRWKVVDKLGEGGCGAVYLVQNTKNLQKAALKAESNFVAGGSVLKLEVQILKKLIGRKYVAQLLTSGKKEKYGYMVMTVFGPSLSRIFKHCKREFSVSTQIRLGMQILYGLKQLHEVGYVHRDVKPANFAIGLKGKESRVIHLLDFGLAREFVIKNEAGFLELRRPRENTLFRGTVKYCSVNSHKRAEQGRPDDLWSMVYMLVEMRGPLPWDRSHDKHQIGKIKKDVTDEDLLLKCPPQMLEITAHLRELDYYIRPDYLRIYSIFEDMMNVNGIKYSDLYDWEIERRPKGYGTAGSTDKLKGGKLRRKISKILTVSEDVSMQKTSHVGEAQVSASINDKTSMQDESDEKQPPFSAEEFEKNELGF
uniref:Protein kinase domain-containing protein n=1 Tax=Panagrolaimus superbus TaxID=310955 RepID=A0A914YR93_9BILA